MNCTNEQRHRMLQVFALYILCSCFIVCCNSDDKRIANDKLVAVDAINQSFNAYNNFNRFGTRRILELRRTKDMSDRKVLHMDLLEDQLQSLESQIAALSKISSPALKDEVNILRQILVIEVEIVRTGMVAWPKFYQSLEESVLEPDAYRVQANRIEILFIELLELRRKRMTMS